MLKLVPTATSSRESIEKASAFAEQVREAQSSSVVEEMDTLTTKNLSSMTEHAFGFAEAMTAKWRPASNPPVDCVEGCDHCCYQLVAVTAPEVFRVVDYLREKLPVNDRQLITSRLKQLDRATRGINTKGRTTIKKPCAFLDAGRCSIYPVRPMACVEFTSYNVQDCKRGKRIGFKEDGVIHERVGMVIYLAVHHGLMDGLRTVLPDAK